MIHHHGESKKERIITIVKIAAWAGVELKTDLGTTHEVDADIDPWVVNVAVAYKF